VVAVLVWKILKFSTLRAEPSERAMILLWVPGKDMQSSGATDKAPCWWCREQVSALGNHARDLLRGG